MGYISEVKITKAPIMIAATLQRLRSQQAQTRHFVHSSYRMIDDGKGDVLSGNQTCDLALHVFGERRF